MRVAFLYPGIVCQGYGKHSVRLEDGESLPVAALALLAGVAREAGHEVELLDLRMLTSEDHLDRLLKTSEAKVVAITVQSPSFNVAHHVARMAKRHGKITVGGGIHATVAPDDFSPDGWDYVVTGEGERAFAELLGRIERGESSPRVIAGNILENLDELPIPHHFPEWNAWYRGWYGIEVTRGCVGRCTYCVSGQKKYYQKLRSRSDEHVLKEIAYAYEKFHFQHLAFVDVNVTSNIRRFNNLLRKVHALYPQLEVGIQSRADTFNEETAQIMSSFAGPGLVWFGFESASPRVLEYINKQSSPEEEWRAVNLCKRYGIRIAAMFIIGVPIETDDDIRMSYDFAKAMKPDILCVNICSPFPGTPMYDQCLAEGLLPQPLTQERFHIQKIFERGLFPQVDYDNVRYWQSLFHLGHTTSPVDKAATAVLTHLPRSWSRFAYHHIPSAQMKRVYEIVVAKTGKAKALAENMRRTAAMVAALRHVRARLSKRRFAIVGIHPWLAWFQRLGLFGDGQLVGLIDPDVRRWGDCVEGVDVYSATAAKRLDLEIALALDASGRTADIRAELGEAGIEVIPLTA